MEVLRNTSAIANLIRNGNWQQIHAMVETQSRDGMNTLERHLSELVRAGRITRDEAMRHSSDPSITARF